MQTYNNTEHAGPYKMHNLCVLTIVVSVFVL